jgi:hypothetical protein
MISDEQFLTESINFANMNRSRIVIALISTVVLASCETDVDLTAPYDSTPVVFGLLDAKADSQFIKINKTFLGDGNVLEYALVRDSLEYNPDVVFARVEEWVNGNVANTFDLEHKTIDNKEVNGIFYGPEQTIYYCATPEGLNEDATYRLAIDFSNGESAVRAETDMVETPVDNANIIRPPSNNPNFLMQLANQQTELNGTYPDFTFKWRSTPGAARYEAKLRFIYTEKVWSDLEHTILVEENQRYFDWNLGTHLTPDLLGNYEIEVLRNGEAFFRSMGESLVADPYVTREAGYYNSEDFNYPVFYFILSIANGELDTYIDVNSPVTGIIQERPAYTNLVNGLGLFASKASQQVEDIECNNYTIRELWNGQFTVDLNFCSVDPIYQNEQFYCGD